MLCDELLDVGMKVSEATYHAALEKLGERQTFEVRIDCLGGSRMTVQSLGELGMII